MFRIAYQFHRLGDWHFTPTVRRLADAQAIRDRYRDSGDYFRVKLLTATEAAQIHKRQTAPHSYTTALYAKGI